jgi:hypothetical protein
MPRTVFAAFGTYAPEHVVTHAAPTARVGFTRASALVRW